MANLVGGFETRVASRLSAELISRATEAMEYAAVRIVEVLKVSAAPFEDTGEMGRSITADVVGGLGGGRPREILLIVTATAPHAEWVDKGTKQGGAGVIRPVASRFLKVGQRAPYRRNAPAKFKGVVMNRKQVYGQLATHWFSAPNGVPLNVLINRRYAGRFRRTR